MMMSYEADVDHHDPGLITRRGPAGALNSRIEDAANTVPSETSVSCLSTEACHIQIEVASSNPGLAGCTEAGAANTVPESEDQIAPLLQIDDERLDTIKQTAQDPWDNIELLLSLPDDILGVLCCKQQATRIRGLPVVLMLLTLVAALMSQQLYRLDAVAMGAVSVAIMIFWKRSRAFLLNQTARQIKLLIICFVMLASSWWGVTVRLMWNDRFITTYQISLIHFVLLAVAAQHHQVPKL